jgi:hypothetical protein
LGDTSGDRPLPKTRLHYAVSACAFELTRRVAGNIVTAHAGFAYLNALTNPPCNIIFVSLGDAHTLLIRARYFLQHDARPIAAATRIVRLRNCMAHYRLLTTSVHGAV